VFLSIEDPANDLGFFRHQFQFSRDYVQRIHRTLKQKRSAFRDSGIDFLRSLGYVALHQRDSAGPPQPGGEFPGLAVSGAPLEIAIRGGERGSRIFLPLRGLGFCIVARQEPKRLHAATKVLLSGFEFR